MLIIFSKSLPHSHIKARQEKVLFVQPASKENMEKRQIYDVVDERRVNSNKRQVNSTWRKKIEMTTTSSTTHLDNYLDNYLDMEMNASYQPSTMAKDYEVPSTTAEDDHYMDIGMNVSYLASAKTNHGPQRTDYNDI